MLLKETEEAPRSENETSAAECLILKRKMVTTDFTRVRPQRHRTRTRQLRLRPGQARDRSCGHPRCRRASAFTNRHRPALQRLRRARPQSRTRCPCHPRAVGSLVRTGPGNRRLGQRRANPEFHPCFRCRPRSGPTNRPSRGSGSREHRPPTRSLDPRAARTSHGNFRHPQTADI